jgi:hypothetical protein
MHQLDALRRTFIVLNEFDNCFAKDDELDNCFARLSTDSHWQATSKLNFATGQEIDSILQLLTRLIYNS